MSIQTPFQRLYASTVQVTTTATAAAADTKAAGSGMWFSWPELRFDGFPVKTSTQLQPFTTAVAKLDHYVLRCLFSLSTAQRRTLWITLLSTGLAVGTYISYSCVWPRVTQGMRSYVWDAYDVCLAPITRTDACGSNDATHTSPSASGGGPSLAASDNHNPRVCTNTVSMDSDNDRHTSCITSSSTLPIFLPSVLQRALNAVHSHKLTKQAATATTVLLERQDHQWFTTLQKHVAAGSAIVGVSVRVPATLLLASTDEVVTLNRWLEVDVRRAPPTNSPVCLWSNNVGDTSNTDIDSGYAHPSEDDASAPLDGLHLSALLRDVVGHQFERQHQPLPALQYRVHNQLCTPEHATRYGLEVATVVAGVVCGCVLASPSSAESMITTHTSLTSWAASDIGPRCKYEWKVYVDEREAAKAEDHTDSPSPTTLDLPSPSLPNKTPPSPLAVQSRIAAALWESESDEEKDTDPHYYAHEDEDRDPDPRLTTVPLTDDDAPVQDDADIPVTKPIPAAQPIVVCGQLHWATKHDATDDAECVDQSKSWPADAIAQTLAKHLNEVLRPSASPLCPKVHVNVEGELYVLSHAPIGLTVKQLLVQACEAHGCTLQFHCLARVYRAGTSATCKVRQTWVSSVELV